MYIYIYKHICIYTHTCRRADTTSSHHICMDTHTYIHTYMHTYTQTEELVSRKNHYCRLVGRQQTTTTQASTAAKPTPNLPVLDPKKAIAMAHGLVRIMAQTGAPTIEHALALSMDPAKAKMVAEIITQSLAKAGLQRKPGTTVAQMVPNKEDAAQYVTEPQAEVVQPTAQPWADVVHL
jgi:hypothetical protein